MGGLSRLATIEAMLTFETLSHDIIHIGSETWAAPGIPDPLSFNKVDMTALATNNEVWDELKEVFGHAQVVEAWLEQ